MKQASRTGPIMLTLLLACASVLAQQPQGQAPAGAPHAAAPSQVEQPIEQAELLERIASRDPHTLVLDVRALAEFASGHVPSARNIPHDQIRERIAELAGARDQEIVVYCRSGRRSAVALEALREQGFTRLRHLDGDFLAWQAAGQPVEGQPVAADKPAGAPDADGAR